MRSKLRVGDYLIRKLKGVSDDSERYEVISITNECVKVLNLKNGWETIEVSWEDLLKEFCGIDSLKNEAQSIENVIKKVQKNLKSEIRQNVKIDLGEIEAIIFPICENLLKLLVFERKTWSGDIKTSSYELPNELNKLKEAYPMLSKNIWDFSEE